MDPQDIRQQFTARADLKPVVYTGMEANQEGTTFHTQKV